MDDVVPTMTARKIGGPTFSPLFVWCGKDCEPVDFEGGTLIAWEKPLSKVYEKWPGLSASNTLVIENKKSRVSCNPRTNVVISSPFCVAELGKLSNDNNFLKSTLWSVLDFRFKSLRISQIKEKKGPRVNLNESTVDSAVMLEGEGTCESRSSILVMSPHLQ